MTRRIASLGLAALLAGCASHTVSTNATAHWQSPNTLSDEERREGFRLLFESAHACAGNAKPDASPIDCIRDAFLEIYNFSKSHPEYHALMFMDRSVPKISHDWQRFGFVREMRGQLTNRIQQAIGRGDFPVGSSPEAIFRVLMVSVLGVCMVRLCDRMAPGEDADTLARVTIDAVLTGFRTGFTHSYRPENCL